VQRAEALSLVGRDRWSHRHPLDGSGPRRSRALNLHVSADF
jgi:hypothetical protein